MRQHQAFSGSSHIQRLCLNLIHLKDQVRRVIVIHTGKENFSLIYNEYE